MAIVVKTIGITARDYATITLWEADLDNVGVYNVGDDAQGECYDDSVFDEAISINGGGTVDLASATLTVAAGQRHSGVAGSGARWARSIVSATYEVTIRAPTGKTYNVAWLEFDRLGARGSIMSIGNAGATDTVAVRNCILHNVIRTDTNFLVYLLETTAQLSRIENSIFYRAERDVAAATQPVAAISGNSSAGRNQEISNTTIHDIVSDGGSGDVWGVKIDDQAAEKIRNVMVTDAGGTTTGAVTCFTPGGPFTNATVSNNLSSDATASGTGSITNVSAAAQYVSIVQGSEDLHIVEGSDARSAGADLGIVPAGINLDINNASRSAFTATVWDIGAHQFELTASIGTASRDYVTITAWEAALDDAVYGQGGARARGECYDDSDFVETVLINGGGGLAHIELTAALSSRHSGVAGTGARILGTSGQIADIITFSRTHTLSWMEIDGNNNRGRGITADGTNRFFTLEHSIIHRTGSSGNTQDGGAVSLDFSQCALRNSIFYDSNSSTDARLVQVTISGGNTATYENCTLYGGNSNGGNLQNFSFRNGTHNVTNCISVGAIGQDFQYFSTPPVTNVDHCMDSDGTADGASNPSNNITSVDPETQFVSTVAGSEDLHIVEGSDAIGAATDLGADLARDINNSDREAFTATVWDIGAHQFEIIASIGMAARDYSTITAWEAALDDSNIYGAGARARGECWNDSVFDEAVIVDGGNLAHRTLTAASSQRHTGVAGSGVRIVRDANGARILTGVGANTTIDGIEIDAAASGSANNEGVVLSEGLASGLIIHNVQRNEGLVHGGETRSGGKLINSIVYNVSINGTSDFRNVAGIRANQNSDQVFNCTMHRIYQPDVGVNSSSRGLRGTSFQGQDHRNNIATDVTSPGLAECFKDVDGDHNASSDATASGTGSLINIVPADQFVSIVVGSEDLHLKEGADVIKAGADLADTPAGVNVDIDGADRHKFMANLWDMGADQYELVASIGTTGRDYATITAWEADFDNAEIYGRQNGRPRGECWADSDFDEFPNINGGGSIGLAFVTLTAEATQRHDGTADSGARLAPTTDNFNGITLNAVGVVEWLEIDGNDRDIIRLFRANTAFVERRVRNMVAHNAQSSVATNVGIQYADLTTTYITNNIVYDIKPTGSNRSAWGIYFVSTGTTYVSNNTVYDCVGNGSGAGVGFNATQDDSDVRCQNNIAAGADICYSAALQNPTNSIVDHNLSSDATATGTGSIINADAVDEFISVIAGSEDLHLKAGASAIDAGIDLGTTPDRVNFDIDNQDRLVMGGPVWDIGADERDSTGEFPVNDATHGHTASSPTSFAAVNDAAHGHTATSPAPGIEPNDAAHGHTAASPLAPSWPQDAQHGHTAGSPGAGGDVNDATHGHTASPAVGGGVPQNAQHTHTATQPWTGFSVNSGQHGHTASPAASVVNPNDATHGHTASEVHSCGVMPAQHGHTATSPASITPTVTKALVQYLLATSNVAAQVGDDIYAEYVPESPCPPYIWLSLRSVTYDSCMDQASGRPDAESFDVEIWSQDLAALKDTLAPAVRGALHRLGTPQHPGDLGPLAVQVVNVADQDENYLPRGNSGPPLYWTAFDVEIVPR